MKTGEQCYFSKAGQERSLWEEACHIQRDKPHSAMWILSAHSPFSPSPCLTRTHHMLQRHPHATSWAHASSPNFHLCSAELPLQIAHDQCPDQWPSASILCQMSLHISLSWPILCLHCTFLSALTEPVHMYTLITSHWTLSHICHN